MSPSYGAAVVPKGHTDCLPVAPLVNETDVPARKVERPDEEIKDDVAAMLIRGVALRLRCAVCLALRLPGLMAKLNNAVGQVFELVVKVEASVASAEVH